METQFNFIKNLNQKGVFTKFEYVLSNNSGYKQIKVINDILEGDQNACIFMGKSMHINPFFINNDMNCSKPSMQVCISALKQVYKNNRDNIQVFKRENWPRSQ